MKMTISEIARKAMLASQTQMPQVIEEALRESSRLTKRVAAMPLTNVPSASLYSDCDGLRSLLHRLQPLARGADIRARLTEAINALSSAQVAVLRNGAPPSEREVE